MKKIVLFVLLFILTLSLSSCDLNLLGLYQPDSVKIGEKNYTKVFSNELFPVKTISIDTEKVEYTGAKFYKCKETRFNCYIAYNPKPIIYFENEQADEAASYYSKGDNFDFFCITGNIHGENDHKLYTIESVDYEMFDSLIQFAIDNEYDPFAFSNNEDGLYSIPVADPDDWTAEEIHFYKVSKDGAFTTSRAHAFVFHENKLCFLYSHNNDSEDMPIMEIKDIPEELSDYFCSLLTKMQIIQ